MITSPGVKERDELMHLLKEGGVYLVFHNLPFQNSPWVSGSGIGQGVSLTLKASVEGYFDFHSVRYNQYGIGLYNGSHSRLHRFGRGYEFLITSAVMVDRKWIPSFIQFIYNVVFHLSGIQRIKIEVQLLSSKFLH